MSPPLNHREIEAIKADIFSSLHCALPGNVETFYPERRTADIRPAVQPGAGNRGIPPPLLEDVPVFLPDTGEGTAPWTISPGDRCLVIFADLPIDAWLAGDENAPVPDRRHDLSDAFAFVGWRWRP